MRKIFIVSILLTILCAQPVSAASKQSFYFDSYSADFYLSRATDGTSALRVSETLTAVFPESDQNHGINRVIPTTNQGGKNFTMDPNAIAINVTRNGATEPIDHIENNDTYHDVYIGNKNVFVHGRQAYQLGYGFTRVITEPNGTKKPQELYWDTNGTAWEQSFNALSARVHLDAASQAAWTGEAWCYVGAHGSSDQSRCTWAKLDDGTIEFKTTGALAPGENLTFDLTFAAGSFVVPLSSQDFSPIFATIAIAGISVLLVAIMLLAYSKQRRRYLNWKHRFIAPEYQPLKNLTVAEACLLSTSAQAQYSLSATLIELAIAGKVKLEETKSKFLGSSKWQVKITSMTGLSDPQHNALLLINGGKPVSTGDTVEIKPRFSNHQMYIIQKAYKEDTEKSLITKRLFKPARAGSIYLAPTVYLVVSIALAIFITDTKYGVETIGADLLVFVIPVVIILTIWAFAIAARVTRTTQRTDEGLKADRKLDGLRLFIKMAEAERIKFFQSAKTADLL